jgi:dihydrolipoamide dehydrogenase
MSQYDLVIIGGGPGGYNGAIRAGQLGMKVACIETRKTLGGTCLNVGCIPSKALLHASEMFEEAGHGFADMGINVSPKLDLKKMMGHKSKTVEGLTQGIAYLFKKNKVEHITGFGRIKAKGEVEVLDAKGKVTQTLATKNILVATGSEVAKLPGVEIDEKQIVSSTGALDLTKVPGKLLVIGAGVIGLELGSVWRRLGAEVTVVEYLDHILPGMDAEVQKNATRIFKKQGLKFKLGSKVTGVKTSKSGCKVTVEPSKGGDADTLDADVVLVCIGRRPFTEGAGLDTVGVAMSDRGFITTDHFKTNVEGIWAVGDCTEGPMLAHKAEDEGVAAVENIAGLAGHINYNTIPGVVYTHPEIANVGKTAEELKAAEIPFKIGKFPFTANSRARCVDDTDGFVKILAHAETDEILGAHIIGPQAGDLIHEVCLAMEFRAASQDIARTCHAHPTVSEAVRQAAMGVEGWTMQM